MKNKHVGSTLTSFLDEEGIREEVDLRTRKKIIADQTRAKMERDQRTSIGAVLLRKKRLR